MKVRMVSKTVFDEDFKKDNGIIGDNAWSVLAYICRVSNPQNQSNPNYEKLLKYCWDNGHVSVFEHAYITIEIECSLYVAMQILRHRSFVFQQFSGRYQNVSDLWYDTPQLRRQDTVNRQNSIDDISDDIINKYQDRIDDLFRNMSSLYSDMLDDDIAKECARVIMPLGWNTRMYMTGNIRSWLHYIQLRTKNGTQKEHADVANAIYDLILLKEPSIISFMNVH